MRPMLTASVQRALIDIVGARQVVTDPDARAPYERDWTGRFVGSSPAVVRPADVDEVAACVAVCADAGVAIVPQGGNTGLVGGSVPLAGEVVLSTRRLTRLDPVDRIAGQVTAGAGVTVAAVQAAATAAGWRYPVDLAARDSATVGGTVATNAGGLHVLRHGATRAQLLGIEAVLGDGSVVSHLHGLVKDNTGYDLAGLLCGSEGTLGVVTAARLRLVPRPRAVTTALVGLPDAATAVRAVAAWRAAVPELEAAELFLAAGLDLVCAAFGLAHPFRGRPPVYVLVEAAGADDPTDRLAGALAETSAASGVGDDAVAVATEPGPRAQLWRYREEHTTAINTLGAPHKLDVTLPLDALGPFIDEVPAVVAAVAPAARTWLFGHVGDGNVHVNVTGLPPDDDRVDGAVLEAVAAAGGSISAEHGIGTAKRRWLPLNRTPAELAAFAAIKRALDPAGILNPGVLLEAAAR
jgi:FAD/FMN-containing dehydrogenase